MPEIKQQIRVIKDCLQAINNTLPYDILPSHMIAHMVSYVVIWMNVFTVGSGIYDTLSPHTIMTGTTLYLTNTANSSLVHMLKPMSVQNPSTPRKTGVSQESALAPLALYRAHTGSSTCVQANIVSAKNGCPSHHHPTSSTVSTCSQIPTTKIWLSVSMIASGTLSNKFIATILPTMQTLSKYQE